MPRKIAGAKRPAVANTENAEILLEANCEKDLHLIEYQNSVHIPVMQ
jgi:hypothetical protein